MDKLPICQEMTVLEVVERWPTTRAIFERYAIPTETTRLPPWETIEQAAAAHGHWAADQLFVDLMQAAGDDADLQLDMPVVEVAGAYPATRAVFKCYGIPCQADRVTPWETIEQAAAARGYWAADSLLGDLNALDILK